MEENEQKFENLEIQKDVKEFVKHISWHFPDHSYRVLLNTVILKLAHCLNCKRIKFDESSKINTPNWFTMIFLDSGVGKDKLYKYLDSTIFKKIYEEINEKCKRLYEEKKFSNSPFLPKKKTEEKEVAKTKVQQNPF